MIVKLLEVRDRATFLPVYAMSSVPSNNSQGYLLRRCGFNTGAFVKHPSIIVSRLNGETPSSADAYFWNDRTMQTAHLYIEQHFDELNDGDVIDVEFILNETTEKKQSERFTSYDL